MSNEKAPPKSDLCRSVPFTVTRSEDNGDDGLTLEGYAAVFDSPTRIDSWEGKFDEKIRRGAFAKTISENTPVLQFDHGSHPLIGSIPIGTIRSLREDENGLHVKARLSNNWLVEPIRQAIAEGAVKGMSFRFSVVREEWDEPKRNDPDSVPSRTLTEVRVAELGPVVWPAYRETSVGVRSQQILSELNDPDVRHEVARALLSIDVSDSMATVEGNGSEEPPTEETSESDAPVREDHPDDTERDAPVSSDHPSQVSKASNLSVRYMRDRARQRAEYMALIEKGQKGER